MKLFAIDLRFHYRDNDTSKEDAVIGQISPMAYVIGAEQGGADKELLIQNKVMLDEIRDVVEKYFPQNSSGQYTLGGL